MIVQLEIADPHDVELILNLARRLNISPIEPKTAAAHSEESREKAIERLQKFAAQSPSSFGDALQWQFLEREDRSMLSLKDIQ